MKYESITIQDNGNGWSVFAGETFLGCISPPNAQNKCNVFGGDFSFITFAPSMWEAVALLTS